MADQQRKPNPRVVALLKKLRGIASNAMCPSCGAGTWDFVETPVMLVAPPDGGFEVFPLVCSNCGHTNLYSTQHLEGPPKRLGTVRTLND
jgi:ribosomal protein S27AE